MTIKFFGLDRQYANLREEILHTTDKVLTSGNVLDGAWVDIFEKAIAKRTQRKFAVAVNSCSQALLFTYIAHSVTKNQTNTIALPAVSFAASANAVALTTREIKFIDVDNNGLMNLNLIDIKQDDIGILSYVNLFGNILDYDKLSVTAKFFNSDVLVVEDAAQSFGASYKGIPSGKLGDVSCLSFDPTKNLPNYGSGGMILLDDDKMYSLLLNLRNNGKLSNHSEVGTNSKMSEVDCAHMMVKLQYFDEWQSRRTKIAEFYNDCLHPYADCPKPNPDVVHAWHKYVIKVADQTKLQDYLKSYGIETKIHYPTTLPEMIAFRNVVPDAVNFPIARILSHTSLSLPIYPEMTDSEVENVVKTVQAYYG